MLIKVLEEGVLFIFLYFVFINDFLIELEDNSKNIGVLNVFSSCLFLVDDILCISLFLIGF